jgi:hypothetical protein
MEGAGTAVGEIARNIRRTAEGMELMTTNISQTGAVASRASWRLGSEVGTRLTSVTARDFLIRGQRRHTSRIEPSDTGIENDRSG